MVAEERTRPRPTRINAETGEIEEQRFDPRKHLTDKVRGKGLYLEVKWRVVWLRDEHPDAEIETQLLEHDREAGYALFRATVRVPSGGIATGHGSETKGDFGDYLEKAETKAVGRALGALGYGTQFCDDYDFGEKVVDSPAEVRNARTAQRQQTQRTAQAAAATAQAAVAAQPAQRQASPATAVWRRANDFFGREGALEIVAKGLRDLGLGESLQALDEAGARRLGEWVERQIEAAQREAEADDREEYPF